MWDKEQDVDEKCEESHEKCWQPQYEERQEEARRVGGRMEVGRNCQAEADEC